MPAIDRRTDAKIALATNVLRLRKSHHMSQGELADRAGLARSTINRIEQGHTVPEWDVIVAIADALGESLDEFRRDPENS